MFVEVVAEVVVGLVDVAVVNEVVLMLSSPSCRFTLLAPDLLRTDSQENIYLQADGLSDPLTVSISIQDFSKTTTLLQDSATLSPENNFHTLKTIQVTHQEFCVFW